MMIIIADRDRDRDRDRVKITSRGYGKFSFLGWAAQSGTPLPQYFLENSFEYSFYMQVNLVLQLDCIKPVDDILMHL